MKQKLFTWDLYKSNKSLHLTLREVLLYHKIHSVIITKYNDLGGAVAAIIIAK